MVDVTTVALLERKRDISRSLFSRYWRDVHGVMAARIPGFATYTQFHVTPLDGIGSRTVEPFEGIAVVTFDSEKNRSGLLHSEISKFIQRDEQNVFRRALLYNLATGATATRISGSVGQQGTGMFMLVPAGTPIGLDSIVASLVTRELDALYTYDLTSGDPSAWNNTDLDEGGAGRRFLALVRAHWSDPDAAPSAVSRAVAKSEGQIAAYKIDATYLMVDGGHPTQLGLRGLDALQTINEARAVNQLEEAVVTAIYGKFVT